MELNQIYNEDCLEGMKRIPDKSIDMILCDLPYGTTACKWDVIIPFEPLWEQYERVVKDNGAILLFGKQPFTSVLILSNVKHFRYELIWNKKTGTDFVQANKKPTNAHENIAVFYKNRPNYNRIDDEGFSAYTRERNNTIEQDNIVSLSTPLKRTNTVNDGSRVPTSIRTYFPDNRKGKGTSLHPTQKPLALIEWAVKSYTTEGDTILDNCMGSGTTAIACMNTNRNFIGVELDENYFRIATERIEQHGRGNRP
jgi:site-specific DNA-methyltransferase (adenine-specific)